MQIKGWKYYNHAMIPTTTPQETPNMNLIENGDVWKMKIVKGLSGVPLLARWTSDYDCGYETDWWYIIKDSPFDIDSLKSKRRYEVNKGKRNFEVRIINPYEYKNKIFDVQVAAFSAYHKKYRPSVNKDKFMSEINNWKKYDVFGAFFKESNELVGFALLSKINDKFIDFAVLKTNPCFEKYSINAGLVYGILFFYENFLKNKGVLCDGSRSINHETHFQDYLEKYFGFRKAYCHLHVRYNPKIKWLIKLCFPFRRVLKFFDKIGVIHQFNSVYKMEEISRNNYPRK